MGEDFGAGRIRHIHWRRFSLALRRPWVTAQGVLHRRCGWVLTLTCDRGLCGVGECSPFPETGTETRGRAGRRLHLVSEWLRGRNPILALHALPTWSETPALRCAVETALLDLVAGWAGRTLASYLEPRAATLVAVNASVGSLDETAPRRVAKALAQGYRVLKVKLGVYPLHTELGRLERIASVLPQGVILRLDANRAWSAPVAREALAGLQGLPVESLEEPLAEPLSRSALRELQSQVPWSLALDESLPAYLRGSPKGELPVRRLVCKPMVLGGLRPILALQRRWGRGTAPELVVTTTLDGSVGTWAALHVAAALNNGLAHGLATSDWLARDLGVGAPPRVRGGVLLVGRGIETARCRESRVGRISGA